MNRPIVYPVFIILSVRIECVGAAVVFVQKNFLRLSLCLDRDNLDAHWHRPQAFLTPDGLTTIDILGNLGVVSWYFAY